MAKMNYPERTPVLSKRQTLRESFRRLMAHKEAFTADTSWVDDAIDDRTGCVKQVETYGLSVYIKADSIDGLDLTFGEMVHLRNHEELVIERSDLDRAFHVVLDKAACEDVANEAESRACFLLTAVLTELLDDAVGTRGDDFTDAQFAAVGRRVLAMRNELEDPPYMGGFSSAWLDKQVVPCLAEACDNINKEN